MEIKKGENKMNTNMFTKKGFTLIELLVVVLIIGILAAIAVPQYQKAILKADLHRGISLVESLYQAQQTYYLANGKFASNLNDLDISVPASCTGNGSKYTCDFGSLNWNNLRILAGVPKPSSIIAYIKYLEDSYISIATPKITLKAGKNYCFARPNNQKAQDVCVSMGGKYIARYSDTWYYYELD